MSDISASRAFQCCAGRLVLGLNPSQLGDAGVNGEAFAVECDIMRHAGMGGTASASLGVGSNFGAIADHPRAKTSREMGGMDVSLAGVVIYFIDSTLSARASAPKAY
jgi:hypothetical protein